MDHVGKDHSVIVLIVSYVYSQIQYTTSYFDGMIAMIDPDNSWVAKSQQLGRVKWHVVVTDTTC